jgi:hypothetical protein
MSQAFSSLRRGSVDGVLQLLLLSFYTRLVLRTEQNVRELDKCSFSKERERRQTAGSIRTNQSPVAEITSF